MESDRSVKAINLQNEEAVGALLKERQAARQQAGCVPDDKGETMPEDETQISNNLSDSFAGDTINNYYYGNAPGQPSTTSPGGILAGASQPVAPSTTSPQKKSLAARVLPLILTGASLTGLGGLAGAALVSVLGGKTTTNTTTVEPAPPGSAAAEISLWYNDPVKGLIRISGAADAEGATIHEDETQ